MATDTYRLGLVEDALEYNRAEGDTEMVARLEAVRDAILNGKAGRPTQHVQDTERHLGRNLSGDNASSRGPQPSNTATAKQRALITRLLDEKAVPTDESLSQATLVGAFKAGCISKRGASQLIDWLMALPMAHTSTGHPIGRPASPKQIETVQSLRAQLGMRTLTATELVMSMDEASQEIEELLAAPKPGQRGGKAAPAELESGMYRKDGVIYKVYRAVHGSGQMVAKRLVVDEDGDDTEVYFDYAGLATRLVSAADRMSLEEAKEFGAIYGVCCQCGQTLTDEKSIKEGIGPKCRNKI